MLLFLAGMVDIARQTVEFLYEENGGIPRDLYLPTIEDIKDEANKFTIDKVRKGLCESINICLRFYAITFVWSIAEIRHWLYICTYMHTYCNL